MAVFSHPSLKDVSSGKRFETRAMDYSCGDVPRLESPAADPGGAGWKGKFLLPFIRQNNHSQQDADDKDVPCSHVEEDTCFIIKGFHRKQYCTVDFTAV